VHGELWTRSRRQAEVIRESTLRRFALASDDRVWLRALLMTMPLLRPQGLMARESDGALRWGATACRLPHLAARVAANRASFPRAVENWRYRNFRGNLGVEVVMKKTRAVEEMEAELRSRGAIFHIDEDCDEACVRRSLRMCSRVRTTSRR
jgi:hypothetical protein